MMRPLAIALTAIALGSFTAGQTPAHAGAYRWCAQVALNDEPSCYFRTFEKCRSYIITSGGVCFARELVEPEAPRQSATRSMTTASSHR